MAEESQVCRQLKDWRASGKSAVYAEKLHTAFGEHHARQFDKNLVWLINWGTK